jgi:hypothetical protein
LVAGAGFEPAAFRLWSAGRGAADAANAEAFGADRADEKGDWLRGQDLNLRPSGYGPQDEELPARQTRKRLVRTGRRKRGLVAGVNPAFDLLFNAYDITRPFDKKPKR